MKNASEHKITVFIVDDDEFLLDMYALKFGASEFAVEIAHNAEEALEKLRKGFRPDVVLLDLVMPKIDGFEFLEIIGKENLLLNSRVIVLSNMGQKDGIERCKKLGIDDYIVKANFTPGEVVEKVKAVVSSKIKNKNL